MPDPGQPNPCMHFAPREGHRDGQCLAIYLYRRDWQFIAGMALITGNLVPLGINGLNEIALLIQ